MSSVQRKFMLISLYCFYFYISVYFEIGWQRQFSHFTIPNSSGERKRDNNNLMFFEYRIQDFNTENLHYLSLCIIIFPLFTCIICINHVYFYYIFQTITSVAGTICYPMDSVKRRLMMQVTYILT